MCAATRRSVALQDASADAEARDETEVRPRPDRLPVDEQPLRR